ncbi:MAG: hypothetical protein KGL39_15035 [Patescibacteria group bacterium]|nr:hypothetical protein [Patescibacteria group bacterium]
MAENYTGLGPTGISANSTLLLAFTRYMNNEYQKLVTTIFESQDDWDWDDTGTTDGSSPTQSTYPIATTPLVAGQRDYTFPLSLNLLKDLRVDISYDGTNYYRAQPIDSREFNIGLGNDVLTDAQFPLTSPRYEFRANAIWIYPSPPGSTGTLRVEYLREPVEFASTATTGTPGIDTAFQPMIPLGASIEWCMTNNPSMVPSLSERYMDYEARLRRYYSRKDEDRIYQFNQVKINYF